MPGLIFDRGDVLLILGISEYETILIAVLGKPYSFLGIRKAYTEMRIFIIYNIFYESFSLHSIVISQEKPTFHELFLSL